jgi:hypothetical protein
VRAVRVGGLCRSRALGSRSRWGNGCWLREIRGRESHATSDLGQLWHCRKESIKLVGNGLGSSGDGTEDGLELGVDLTSESGDVRVVIARENRQDGDFFAAEFLDQGAFLANELYGGLGFGHENRGELVVAAKREVGWIDVDVLVRITTVEGEKWISM